MKHQLKVFLCHASSDKTRVQEIYLRLINDGIDAWLDKEKLIPGQNWQIEIPKAVRNSDVVIVFLSSQSVNKEGFVQKEIKIALDTADEKPEGTIFIIPARLEECEVPERISQFHWVDLFSENGYKLLFTSLQLRANALGINFEPINSSQATPKRETEEKDEESSQKENIPDKEKSKERNKTKPSNEKQTRAKLIQKIQELENLRVTLSTPINKLTLLIGWGVLSLTFLIVIAYITAPVFELLGYENTTTIIISISIISTAISFFAIRKIFLDRENQSRVSLEKTDREIQRVKKMLESVNQQEQSKS